MLYGNITKAVCFVRCLAEEIYLRIYIYYPANSVQYLFYLNFSAAEVLAESSTDTDVDMSNKYSRPIGTPEGSTLNVNAPEFQPAGSSMSIVSAPAPPVYSSADYGPFDP